MCYHSTCSFAPCHDVPLQHTSAFQLTYPQADPVTGFVFRHLMVNHSGKDVRSDLNVSCGSHFSQTENRLPLQHLLSEQVSQPVTRSNTPPSMSFFGTGSPIAHILLSLQLDPTDLNPAGNILSNLTEQ